MNIENRWVAIYIKGIRNFPDNSNVVNKECITREQAIDQLREWKKTVPSPNFCYPQIYDKENDKYEIMTNKL